MTSTPPRGAEEDCLPGQPTAESADGHRIAPPTAIAGATIAILSGVTLLLLAVWKIDRFRAVLGRIGPYLPILLYALVLVTAIASAATTRPGYAERLKRRLRRWQPLAVPMGLLGSITAYIASLATTWRTSRGLSLAIGGVAPWGDASLYFGGAERLLFFGHLDIFNSRRPLTALFLADRLAVTNLNLRGTLVLQAILLGVASFLAARALARDLGAAAGLVLFAVLFGFADLFIGTAMSEPLAIALGALGFAAMWSAIRRRDERLALVGIGLLALAFAARPGPFLLLVFVPLWFAHHLRRSGRINWRFLGTAAAIVVIATGLNYVVVPAFGGDGGNVNGNSSLVLYGMAKGNPGWDLQHQSWSRIFVDYPQLRKLPDPEINAFAQRKAREEILAHPIRFSTAVLRSAKNYAVMAKNDIAQPVHSRWLRWLLLAGIGLLAAWCLARRWRSSRIGTLVDATLFLGVLLSVPVLLEDWPATEHHPSWLGAAIALLGFVAFVARGTGSGHKSPYVSFTIAAFLGFVLSMPILGVDTIRVFAGAVPLIALPLVLAVSTVTRRLTDSPMEAAEEGTGARRAVWVPAWLGVALVAVLFVGTPIAMAAITRPATPTRRCPNGQLAQPLMGGAAVTVVAHQSSSMRTLEEVGINDFRRDSIFYVPVNGVLNSIEPPFTIVAGLTQAGNDRIALVPGRVAAPERSVLYLCGQVIHDPEAQLLLQYWPQPFDFFRVTSVFPR